MVDDLVRGCGRMSSNCPVCGMGKQCDVAVGVRANETGERFWCGTIYWPSQNRITSRGVSCKKLEEYKQKLEKIRVISKYVISTYEDFQPSICKYIIHIKDLCKDE